MTILLPGDKDKDVAVGSGARQRAGGATVREGANGHSEDGMDVSRAGSQWSHFFKQQGQTQ